MDDQNLNSAETNEGQEWSEAEAETETADEGVILETYEMMEISEEIESGMDADETDAAADADPASPGSDGLARNIEAVLFIAPDPVSLEVLAEVTGAEGEALAHAVEAVREKYSDPDGGIIFAEIAGGYTFRTGDLAREAVERFCRRPIDYSLSPAAMETLAIVAYLQPITRPEIARIRGVGADTVVANLLDKGLVAEAGRAEQTGAVKYHTTESFEKLFGITDIAGLPSLEGFEATPADVEELREKLHLAADKRQ